MFEHKNLDGVWNRVVPSSDVFVNGDVLEMRESTTKDPQASSRKQYSVVGERLVERCLPPEGVGDRWSYDAVDVPWWTAVKNPPHMGIVAEFNSHNGGKHRIPLEVEQNVVAFASSGEEITFRAGAYRLKRKKDEKEISAPTLPEIRAQYFSEN